MEYLSVFSVLLCEATERRGQRDKKEPHRNMTMHTFVARTQGTGTGVSTLTAEITELNKFNETSKHFLLLKRKRKKVRKNEMQVFGRNI